MRLVEFPGCCTALVLVGFGQSNTAAWEYRPDREYTQDTFFKAAREKLEEAGRRNKATVIAITNSDQTTAIATLPLLGFSCVQKDLGKEQHADKTVSTWVYTVTGKDRLPLPVPKNPFAKPEAPVEEFLKLATLPHPALNTLLWTTIRDKNASRKIFKSSEMAILRRNFKQVWDSLNPATRRTDFHTTSLRNAFVWKNTDQGTIYWFRIYARLVRG